MSVRLRRLVTQRAKNRCEYCHLPQELFAAARFHVEHVLPKQHDGPDDESNRCLACGRCNWRKGPNLAGVDAVTGRLVFLFHPRRQTWGRHFRWRGAMLIGRTAVGRVTIAVLGINQSDRVKLRKALIDEGVFP